MNYREMLLPILIAVVSMGEPSHGQQSPIDLRAEYDRLVRQHTESMPAWRPHPPEKGSLLFVAFDQYSADTGDAKRLSAQRVEFADELFDLAKRAASAGQLSSAYQWATEAVRENPNHADARRVLGYEQRGGKWLTPYSVRMAEAGKIWHPKFGWIAEADLPRYEAGERQVRTRWISVADDAARRKDISSGWQVRTDHFLVTTDHSLEAAADLAARLERLHQVWRQLFAGFYLSENEVRRLFDGEGEPRKQVRPFRVYYHRDRDQYVAALRRRQPRIAETLGIYFDADHEAHFFADPDQSLSTLYHEAAHQLFQESKPAAKKIGNSANFWVVEGVAMYFESLIEHADNAAGLYYTVGEPTAGRLPKARQRLLEGFYVPLDELTHMGMHEVQEPAKIASLYTQSAGLAAFLIDGEQGRYREPLVRYLDVVYAGRDNDQSLAELTGASYHELDAQYRRYMESLP